MSSGGSNSSSNSNSNSRESDSDSDDDCAFFPVPTGFGAGAAIEEENFNDPDATIPLSQSTSLFVKHMMEYLLYRDGDLVLEYAARLTDAAQIRACNQVAMLLSGKYIELISGPTPAGPAADSCHPCISYSALAPYLPNVDAAADVILRYIAAGSCDPTPNTSSSSSDPDGTTAAQLRALECTVLGLAFTELFCQLNYTGPELPTAALEQFRRPPSGAKGNCGSGSGNGSGSDEDEAAWHASCVRLLEVDGEYPYPLLELPVALLLGRTVLSALASVQDDVALWPHGVVPAPSVDLSVEAESSGRVGGSGSGSVVRAKQAVPLFTRLLAHAPDCSSSTGSSTSSSTSSAVAQPTTKQVLVMRQILRPAGAGADAATGMEVAPAVAWLGARAAVTHLRLISSTSSTTSTAASAASTASGKVLGSRGMGRVTCTADRLPTLHREASELYALAAGVYGAMCRGVAAAGGDLADAQRRPFGQAALFKHGTVGSALVQTVCSSAEGAAANASTDTDIEQQLHHLRVMETQLWLEVGLCCYHFGTESLGKEHFLRAQESARLSVQLSGAMGRRTKYQTVDYAQLILKTESTLVRHCSGLKEVPPEPTTGEVKEVDPFSPTALARQRYMKLEIGRRAVVRTEEGAGAGAGAEGGKTAVKAASAVQEAPEVSIRNVQLRSVETGGGADEDDDEEGEQGGDAKVKVDKSEDVIYFEDGVHYTEQVQQGQGQGQATGMSEEELKAARTTGCDYGKAASAVLHWVDQAVVLALCLDVENSHSKDGLTTEEMRPYVQCVLNCNAKYEKEEAKKRNSTSSRRPASTAAVAASSRDPEGQAAPEFALESNWMIFSTALLQRSWLEFEKRRTMDRALLQIQALIDQHSTKLTVMQSTVESTVEQAAPVSERMRFLHCIAYPAQYELKADLARRYLHCGVLQSALAYFRELELWDEVVTCYQLLEKPYRAEMVVRERMAAVKEPSPYMLTSLGDLTGRLEYYEEAWSVSGGRFARAKRTLGRRLFDKGDYRAAIGHFTEALKVQPVNPQFWYLRGVAAMRLAPDASSASVTKSDEPLSEVARNDFNVAIESFLRCVEQQELSDEFAEAYANLGAVYTRLGLYPRAYNAFKEALRLNRDSWKIVENLMLTSLVLGKLQECMSHMGRLVDLRHVSRRSVAAVHVEELRRLSYLVGTAQVAEWKKARARASAAGGAGSGSAATGTEASSADASSTAAAPTPTLSFGNDYVRLINLLDKIANATSRGAHSSTAVTVVDGNTSPSGLAELWELYAELQRTVGNFGSCRECRLKQMRALLVDLAECSTTGRSELAVAEQLFEAAEYLVEAHFVAVSVAVDQRTGTVTATAQAASVATSAQECKSILSSVITKLQKSEIDGGVAAAPPPAPPAAGRVTWSEEVKDNSSPAPAPPTESFLSAKKVLVAKFSALLKKLE